MRVRVQGLGHLDELADHSSEFCSLTGSSRKLAVGPKAIGFRA